MEKKTEYQPATFESVWEAFRESDRQRKENERILNEKFAETDRQFKETDRQFKETDRQFKESHETFKQEMKEASDRFDREMEKSRAEYDRRMKNMEDRYGAMSNNHGFFAEEYFFNAFENGNKTFFGEDFDDIERNVKPLKPVIKDEYDIVFLNGKSVGIIESKYRAHENDIPKIINKAKTLKTNYPTLSNHKIYLGLASFSFYPELENECIKNGIAVVKQVGDTVVINDENLKTF